MDIDSRSRKKGPEPETVVTGQIGDKCYAFVALERIGGIMVFDVTEPAKASYVNYVNTRDFSDAIEGDVAPEGLAFVPSDASASGKPVVLAACEVPGTVAAYTLSGKVTTEISGESGSISFASAVADGENLHLSISEVTLESISEELKAAQPNLLAVFDISVLDGANRIVAVDNNELTIRLRLPDSLKGYDTYQVVYIKGGAIVETLSASVEEGYLVFKTTHLSQYGIVATKTGSTSGENTSGNENTEPEVSAPQMGDENHMLLILLTGIGALVVAMMIRRRMINAK